MAALRFDVGRSFAVVGNVLVLGFVLGKISAILSKISAILGKLGPSGRLGLVLGASWGRLGPLGRQVGALGGKLGSSGHLGRILGPSWAVLGAAWAASWGQVAVLGASWAHLGAVLGRLGRQVGAKWPSWARLGAVLGGLGRDLGAKMGPKIDQKTDQNLEAISRSIFGVTSEFLEPTCSDFGPSWTPWIFKKIMGFPFVRLMFLKFVGKRFGQAIFSTKRRSKRPTQGPR